jgi:hypothetical protein
MQLEMDWNERYTKVFTDFEIHDPIHHQTLQRTSLAFLLECNFEQFEIKLDEKISEKVKRAFSHTLYDKTFDEPAKLIAGMEG